MFLGGSGALAVVLYILDRLVTPVDCDGPKAAELNHLESKFIATYFIPLAKSVDPSAKVPAPEDIETVHTGYNYSISAIERGRYCDLLFDSAFRNLARGLAAAAAFLAVPGAASLVYTPTGGLDWFAYMVIGCVAGIVGSLAFAGLALAQMRKLRQHYHDAVGSLEGVLSTKKLNDSLSHEGMSK